MKRHNFASFWLAAADSGFAQPSEWIAWADRVIAMCDNPPTWILDLSLANSSDQLWSILPQVIETGPHENNDASASQDAVLGYFWLRFERGDFDLRTCLQKSGEYADSNDTSLDCETFFSLLNRLEGIEQSATHQMNILSSATSLFAPMKALAEKQWGMLSDEALCF